METQRYITLTKEKTFEYLAELKETITQVKTPDDLPGITHRQLYNIISAEEKFLRNYHTEPMIAVAPNGLPTLETLKADLETMCKLEEFKELAEKYLPNKENCKEGPKYSTIPKEEWDKQKSNHKKLTSKERFTIGEQEGRLELTLTEEHYTKGYDEHSQKYPLLTKESTTRYRTEFGTLIPESEEQHKMANTTLTKNKKPSQSPTSRGRIEPALFPAVIITFMLGVVSLAGYGINNDNKQYAARKIEQIKKLELIKEAYPELNIQTNSIYGMDDFPEYYYATDKNELIFLNKDSNLTETYYALKARMKTK